MLKFLLILFVISCCCADIVVYNASSSCLNGCSFSDNSIWVGGNVPTQNDQVQVISNGATVRITVNENTIINSLTIKNVVLVISSLLSVNADVIVNSSSLVVPTAGSFYSQSGTFNLDIYSNISLMDDGTFFLRSQQAAYYGSVFTTSHSNFSSYAENSFFYSQNSFNSRAYFYNLNIQNNIVFQMGLSFAGNLTISSSVSVYQFISPLGTIFLSESATLNIISAIVPQFYFIMPHGSGTLAISSSYGISILTQEFNGKYILGGESSISLTMPFLYSSQLSFVNGANNEAANITLNIVSSVNWISQNTNPSPVPVNIIINNGFSLHLIGVFSLTGGISVKGGALFFDSNTTLSSVMCGPITLETGTMNSLFIPSGVVSTPILQVSSSNNNLISNIQINNNVTFNSLLQILKGGNLQISSSGSLIVNGNYTQESESLYSVGSLVLNSASPLSILGDAQLGGSVTYSSSEPLVKGAKYVIMNVAGNLQGSFSGKAASQDSHDKLDIDYSQPHFVYLVYNTTKHNLAWYYWLAIGGAIALVVISIVAILFVRRRKRAGYSPVSH